MYLRNKQKAATKEVSVESLDPNRGLSLVKLRYCGATVTISPWPSGKCVRFSAGRSGVQLSAAERVLLRPCKLAL